MHYLTDTDVSKTETAGYEAATLFISLHDSQIIYKAPV